MPAETQSPEIWSVSGLTRQIKGLLEKQVGQVWVEGEISNWRVSPAGHAYFTLKDDASQLDAVLFRNRLGRLPFRPEAGLEVVAQGQISVYERRGNYQIVCEQMQPKGLGALQLAFEQLKKKLREEGLFDEEHKKALPLLPRRIGVVTSPTGAAVRDILNVIGRRFANVHVLLYPARVQGEEAAPEIVAGIETLDAYGVDVMIIGRGGGSLEDLWPFNEEAVVRAVFAAKTPVISAVGHEIDYALTDFAADVRAPTPSAAAELVVQEREALLQRTAQTRQRLVQALDRQTERLRARLTLASSSAAMRRPGDFVRERQQQVDDLRLRLERAAAQRRQAQSQHVADLRRALRLVSPRAQVRQARERLAALKGQALRAGRAMVEIQRGRLRPVVAQLDALSPLAVLGRGYSLTWKETDEGRRLVRTSSGVAPGDAVTLQFGRGAASARIESTEEPEAHGGDV